jgi:hypothetical protein
VADVVDDGDAGNSQADRKHVAGYENDVRWVAV